MKTIGVLTSGGDAPGMNAAVRAVTRTAKHAGLEVIGIERGYEGLINGQFIRLGVHSVSDMMQRGGTFLKTARSERFRTEEGLEEAMVSIERAGIDGIVAIGGDGTFRGAAELADRGVKVAGIPATIDNDMGYTDRTIGFDTAVHTAVEAVGKLRDTSASHERVTVVEVMGRKSGDIALYTAVSCGAEMVLIPERPVTLESLCRQIQADREVGRTHSIIVNAEGSGYDSAKLASDLRELTGSDHRSVILGYIQRGGSPVPSDRILAGVLGSRAVKGLMEGKTGAYGIRDGKVRECGIREAPEETKPFEEELYGLISGLSLRGEK